MYFFLLLFCSLKTLGEMCLHIEGVKRKNVKKGEVLPEYNCLILSPANLWQRSIELFNQDTNLIASIFSYEVSNSTFRIICNVNLTDQFFFFFYFLQNGQRGGRLNLAETMFGMSLKETGMKRSPFRNRQRVLQYAVTIFLKEYDAK